MIQRRRFLTLVLGSIASGTFLSDRSMAGAALVAPSEDLIAKTVRLSREVAIRYEAYRPYLEEGGGLKASGDGSLIKNAVIDGYSALLHHLIDDRFGEPNVFDIKLLMQAPTFWKFDIFNEADVRAIAIGTVPVAVVRCIHLKYCRLDAGRLGAFSAFAQRYRDTIFSPDLQSLHSDFVTRFNEAVCCRREDIQEQMRESYVTYRRSGTGLYVPCERIKSL